MQSNEYPRLPWFIRLCQVSVLLVLVSKSFNRTVNKLTTVLKFTYSLLTLQSTYVYIRTMTATANRVGGTDGRCICLVDVSLDRRVKTIVLPARKRKRFFFLFANLNTNCISRYKITLLSLFTVFNKLDWLLTYVN